MRSIRQRLGNAVDVETVRLQAEALGLDRDEVAWLEAEADRAGWLPLHEAMRRLVVTVHLGQWPTAPVTMVDHVGVLRAQVRRLGWGMVVDLVGWLGRRLTHVDRARAERCNTRRSSMTDAERRILLKLVEAGMAGLGRIDITDQGGAVLDTYIELEPDEIEALHALEDEVRAARGGDRS